MRVEQALKAPEQNGKVRLLLIAVLCAVVAALFGLALLRSPSPTSGPAPAVAVPALPPDRQAVVETRLREQVEGLIGTIVGRENVRAIVSAEIEPDQTRQVSEAREPGINSTETTTIRSSGQIRRLTVSVMVNGHQAEGADYRPRTEAELARFTRLARDAVGFDAIRGDSLTVETVRFAPTQAAPAFFGIGEDALLPLACIGLAGILGLAVLFLTLRAFGRSAPAVPEPEAAEAPPPAPVFEPFTADTAHSPALRRAGEAVTTRPAAAAAVVRQWMSA